MAAALGSTYALSREEQERAAIERAIADGRVTKCPSFGSGPLPHYDETLRESISQAYKAWQRKKNVKVRQLTASALRGLKRRKRNA